MARPQGVRRLRTYEDSREVGKRLVEQAEMEINGWRNKPTEVLIRYAELCMNEETRQTRKFERNLVERGLITGVDKMKTKSEVRDDCQDLEYGRCKRGFKCSPTCEKFNSKYIKILVSCDGDRSVGIWGDNTEVLIERRFIEGNYGPVAENRKWIKKEIAAIFKELFDDTSTRCPFEDECYNCGNPKPECKCPPDDV